MKEFFSQFYIKRVLKYALFMFLALALQNMIFTQFRPLGVCPMVLPAVCVAVGMFEGATWGSVFALIMGIFADMAFVENTILFTVLFPAIAFATGFVSQFFINRRFFAFMGLCVAALFLTSITQMVMTIARDTFSAVMLKVAGLQTLWSIPFSAAAYFPAAKWIE